MVLENGRNEGQTALSLPATPDQPPSIDISSSTLSCGGVSPRLNILFIFPFALEIYRLSLFFLIVSRPSLTPGGVGGLGGVTQTINPISFFLSPQAQTSSLLKLRIGRAENPDNDQVSCTRVVLIKITD